MVPKVNSAKKSTGNKSPDHDRSGNNLKNDKEVVDNMKKYIKQKTLGWKQTTNDTTKWPYKRSPTHKSNRNADQAS